MGNRKKAKAKRFAKVDRGSAGASPVYTHGVGNAFGSAPARSGLPAPGSRARSGKRPLLVVDGYNVIYATPRYERLVYDHSDDPLSRDVYPRAREALISDVAAFAQASYEAVVVFDGAGNKNPERPNIGAAGVRVVFSPPNVSADRVIEQLCTDAREEGREVAVATSDGTIQAVAMGKGVTRISARMLVDEIRSIDADVAEAEEAPQVKLTLGSRLSPEALAKLEALRNRG